MIANYLDMVIAQVYIVLILTMSLQFVNITEITIVF